MGADLKVLVLTEAALVAEQAIYVRYSPFERTSPANSITLSAIY